MKTILFCLILCIQLSAMAQWADAHKNTIRTSPVVKDGSMDDYDVKFYFLDIKVDNQSIDVEGTAEIHVEFSNPDVAQFYFMLDNAMTVSQVRINEQIVDFTHQDDMIYLPTPEIIDGVTVVEIDYAGTPEYGMFNKNHYLWMTKTTYSMTEPFDAFGWFPVKQDLYDKADSSWVFVTVPDNLMAGSNGLLTNTEDNGDGTLTFQWKSNFPIAYYLISISVGEYQDYSIYAHPTNSEDSILIQNFVFNKTGYLSMYEWEINQSKPIMEVFCEKFGLYPHANEKYGHCIAGLNGGMEHQTMTTMGNFGFNLVAHEMGHSWFGNYVTCATWQDIWINEGFAVYSEVIAHENISDYDTFWGHLTANMSDAKYYSEGSVYVPFEESNDASRIFDYYLSYKKGGMLVHMIRYLLNDDDLFFDILREYLSTYANGVATGEDFREVLETESGMDFSAFFDEWYYGEGYPEYHAEWYQKNDSLFMRTTQTGSTPEAPLFTIPLTYRVYFMDGDSLDFRLASYDEISEFSIPMTEEISNIVMDPDVWVISNTSIEQVSALPDFALNFEIYPNPFTDKVQLRFISTRNRYILVTDNLGKSIMNIKTDEEKFEINLSNYTSGIYYMLLSDEFGNNRTLKLVKM
jgi:aminopeptidase N